MKNFTDPAVTLFQQPRSKLTEPLEHCSGAAGALLQSCWRNVPNMVWKRGTAKILIAKRLQKTSHGDYFEENWVERVQKMCCMRQETAVLCIFAAENAMMLRLGMVGVQFSLHSPNSFFQRKNKCYDL